MNTKEPIKFRSHAHAERIAMQAQREIDSLWKDLEIATRIAKAARSFMIENPIKTAPEQNRV